MVTVNIRERKRRLSVFIVVIAPFAYCFMRKVLGARENLAVFGETKEKK